MCQPITTKEFFDILGGIKNDHDWSVLPFRQEGPIRLKYRNEEALFCPLTAVYHTLTGGKRAMCCFLVPELSEEFGMNEEEVAELARAADACSLGRHYNVELRNKMLHALNHPILPPRHSLYMHAKPEDEALQTVEITYLCPLALNKVVFLRYGQDRVGTFVLVLIRYIGHDNDDEKRYYISDLAALADGHYQFACTAEDLGTSVKGLKALIEVNVPQELKFV